MRGTWTATPLKEYIDGKHQVAITFPIKTQDPETGDITGSLKTEFCVIKISGTISGNRLKLRLKQGSFSADLSGTLTMKSGKLTGVFAGSSNDGTSGKYRLVLVDPKGK